MNDSMINILLVEDDEVDIMNVQRAFKRNHIENPLYIAHDGVEALEMLLGIGGRAIPFPRIILLDINMPRMGGLEFLENIRKNELLKNISVFIMTTSNEENDKLKAYNLNVAGYILKPLSMESFVAAVTTLQSYWKLCEFPTNH
jgi:CheY-like chemotaxis protein